jgi:hypothetical protein
MLLAENLIMQSRSIRPLLSVCVVLTSLWSVGCGDDGAPTAQNPAASPTVPTAPSTPVAPVSPLAPAAAADAGPIPWQVPAGWERVPGERQMRVATFRRAGGEANEEIIVSQFPGEVGGVLANVNRWRAQVGLGPITEDQLAKETRPFDNRKLKGHLMRLRGEKQHMLAAIISEPAAGRTWFVKAVATPTAADALEADVFAFAQSFGTGRLPDAAATQPAK